MAGEFHSIDNALKIGYPAKAIEAVVNEELVFRPWLKKSVPAGSRWTKGGWLQFGANLAPPQNVGQTLDGGTLAPPKDRLDKQFLLKPTLFNGSFQLGWVAESVAIGPDGAFNGGELRRRTEETASNLGKFIESTYVGTDGTGVRAYVDTGVTATTFTAKKPQVHKLLRQNMYISVRDSANFATIRANADRVKITGIDPDTFLITTDAGSNFTLTANDVVIPVVETSQVFSGGSLGASSYYSTFANGLRGLIDDGTNARYIHGLDRNDATLVNLKSVVADNGGTLRNLTEQVMIRTCHKVRELSSKTPSVVLCGPGFIEKWIEFVAPERNRPVTGKGRMGMALGYQEGDLVHYAPGVALEFLLSFDVVPREAFLLTPSTFFHYLARETDWMDKDSMLKTTPTSGGHKASWLAYMASVENIGNDMPRANAVIRDLKDPSIGDS